MKIIIHIEHGKDATGDKKRVMWVDVLTNITGMERITSVSELPEDSILGKEVDFIVTEMLALKQKELKKKFDGEKAKKRLVKKEK